MMMTSAQVVETSVNITTNSPSQDCIHPDDHTLLTYEIGFVSLSFHIKYDDLRKQTTN